MASLLLICLPLVALMVNQVALAKVFLWPQPRSIAWGSGSPIFLSLSFHFRLPAQSPPELLLAASRYRRLIFKEKWVPVSVSANAQTASINSIPFELPYVTVSVADLHADLQQGVKEGYTIIVPDYGGANASLKADTIWGALHGFETFSQLVKWDSEAQKIMLERGVILSDAPLYGYRGIMLDVARNFYPVPDLLRTVRAMAYNKLNVLHLHLTDSQSFPLEIATEPKLAQEGTFGPQFIYYATDIQKLVSYARYHGVRIVP
ncbi:hypothetical protein L7F22_042454 [Adiantum nelumboides]|nr:hypothetical protein [Adiantum nelumboides]